MCGNTHLMEKFNSFQSKIHLGFSETVHVCMHSEHAFKYLLSHLAVASSEYISKETLDEVTHVV